MILHGSVLVAQTVTLIKSIITSTQIVRAQDVEKADARRNQSCKGVDLT